jgi:hypothetical protein
VTLEVDHIEPKSKGGADALSNLLCSCKDCNRGKGAKRLGDAVPDAVTQNVREVKEQVAQLKALERWTRKLQDAKEKSYQIVYDAWCEHWDGKYGLTEHGRKSVRQFVDMLGVQDTVDAMRVAAAKRDKTPDMLDPSDHGQSMYKYWCGICWRWIREGKQDFRSRRG